MGWVNWATISRICPSRAVGNQFLPLPEKRRRVVYVRRAAEFSIPHPITPWPPNPHHPNRQRVFLLPLQSLLPSLNHQGLCLVRGKVPGWPGFVPSPGTASHLCHLPLGVGLPREQVVGENHLPRWTSSYPRGARAPTPGRRRSVIILPDFHLPAYRGAASPSGAANLGSLGRTGPSWKFCFLGGLVASALWQAPGKFWFCRLPRFLSLPAWGSCSFCRFLHPVWKQRSRRCRFGPRVGCVPWLLC